MGLREERQAVGEEDGFELEAPKFFYGFPKFGGIRAILVGEEFQLIEVDQGIAHDEVTAIAPRGFSGCAAGEPNEEKSRDGIALFAPDIGLDFSLGGIRGMDGSLEDRPEREAVALVVSAGEGDGMDFGHGQQLRPCGNG